MTERSKLDITFENNWLLKNHSYNSDSEFLIETLFSQGNGYLISRANIDETESNKINYTGNYIVGLYNKALHIIGDKKIERDEIVNLPNWWQINFKIENNSWFDINRTHIEKFERILNIRNGLLSKSLKVKDKIGHLTQVNTERIINYKNPNIIAQKYIIQPDNYSGKIKIETRINGNIYNERDIKAKHLYISDKEGVNNNVYLIAETLKSNKTILVYNRLTVTLNDKPQNVYYQFYEKEREIFGEFEIDLKEGDILQIEKTGYIGCYDLMIDTKKIITDAKSSLDRYINFNNVVEESEQKWNEIWDEIGIEIKSDDVIQPYLNFYIYNILITYSENTINNFSGFPSHSIQAEKNQGLSGWEELFVIPFFNLNFPDLAKKILEYRKNRLSKAKENASSYKIKGALFPWKSGTEGNEQSYKEKYDPIKKIWLDDYGYLQKHINISVAHNIIQYFKITSDKEFLLNGGIQTLFEICRFWADIVEFDRERNRYNINSVIGPDEFHIKYTDSYKPGLNNNAYTNFMVVWLMVNVLQIEHLLSNIERKKIFSDLKIRKEELEKWKDISMFMKIEIDDDEIIEQFSGFFSLTQIDWSEYRKKFKDIHKIDKIFSAEGKSTNEYQIIKQADALLPFYFLNPGEIREIMLETGYLLEKDFLDTNFKYYFKRTVHNSLLSKPVHSLIAYHNGDISLCYQLFYEALSEVNSLIYDDIWENGINMGVAGALINVLYSAFGGISFKDNHLNIKPYLPEKWRKLKFNIKFKGYYLNISITKDETKIQCLKCGKSEIVIAHGNREYLLEKEKSISFKTKMN